ncbi:Fructosyltransfearse Ftf [Streptococcus sp. DD12]|nr:Fructosyltransfearse Ftf [Streptococcus sp. DD12]
MSFKSKTPQHAKRPRYSIRKVSTIGAASVIVGSFTFLSQGTVSADQVQATPAEAAVTTTVTADSTSDTSTASSADATATSTPAVATETSVATPATDAAGTAVEAAPATTATTEAATEANTDRAATADTTAATTTSPSATADTATTSTPAADTAASTSTAPSIQSTVEKLAAQNLSTTEYVEGTGLNQLANAFAKEANLDIASLTDDQKAALNKLVLSETSATGHQMTYREFQDVADTLVAQDPRYAIPYFKADVIKNMKAATTRDAQTGEVADLDVWDSWPVQDLGTGRVSDWNGYQLVVAMMGVPNANDNHLYLLYNKYGDNDFDHWKNAGAIFGYNVDAVTQQWSGSAAVNSDGSIQLYYTHVDTSDDYSNNQMLATATLNLAVENGEVVLKSVENDRVLTPKGGDGYHYQSYAQWRETRNGIDNIAMRDPHVFQDTDGKRYLIFEASTGTENYQGENQIYNLSNYGGTAEFAAKSLFSILDNQDMKLRAEWSNAAIGILQLEGDEKTPTIKEYYTPLLSAAMVSDELERPNVVKLKDKYYMFTASRLNHGSNDYAWQKADEVVGDNVVMLGYVSDNITTGYKPLNGSGAVLTASVPADWRTATYSYYAVPVDGSDDTMLITAYMTNRNEVAGKGNNSTWAPSFLVQFLPDNTTRVLAEMTQQGDWIWDASSKTLDTVGTLATAHLPNETFGSVDWDKLNSYGNSLKEHQPLPAEKPIVTPGQETKKMTQQITRQIKVKLAKRLQHQRFLLLQTIM